MTRLTIEEEFKLLWKLYCIDQEIDTTNPPAHNDMLSFRNWRANGKALKALTAILHKLLPVMQEIATDKYGDCMCDTPEGAVVWASSLAYETLFKAKLL